MAYRGGGFDAGAGSNFGSENFGGGQGKNDYSSKPKTKTKAQKSYSILSNIVQGFSNMVTVGRQQNADVKAGLRDPADFSTPGNDGDGRNTNSAIPLITTPTTAEVSQATATDATNTTLSQNAALRKKKAKATGRSMTILTSSKGVTSDQGLTLGKKSLLGA